MSNKSPPVWECEHQIEINVPPGAIWALFSDVASWSRWNAGVESVKLHGPFVAGAQFTMTLPDGTSLASRLVEVSINRNFLDETSVGDLRVFVDHRLEPLGAGRTRVVYAVEAFGPGCDEIGPAISADFPDVLKSLAAHAVALAQAEC